MTDINKSQLYRLTCSNFVAPDFVDSNGNLVTRAANDIPIIFWPDKSWCHQANTFIREKFESGLSRRNRGGSLSVLASQISHLIRYCWDTRTDFINLTDNDFRNFVGLLIHEQHPKKPNTKARNSNTVISISRSCLQFIESIGRHSPQTELIGPEGRIRAQLKTRFVGTRVYSGRGKPRKQVTYWDHPAIPAPTVKRTRLPISTENINKLRIAVGSLSKTPHQRMRRHATIKLLEITGARRGEVAAIDIVSVKEASLSDIPMLKIPTLKKHSGHPQFRYVPVSKSDIAFIMQYVEFYRNPLIRKKLKGKQDHGYLLINDVTGQPLSPNSISQEIKLLSKHANIGEVTCAHMFRHRFLTKLFVTLIHQHQIDTPDSFRRLLIDGEGLKQKVAEWSGHANTESLSIYINLAFDEVTNFKKANNSAIARLAIDSFRGTLNAEIQSLTFGESPQEVGNRLIGLLNKFDQDLNSES